MFRPWFLVLVVSGGCTVLPNGGDAGSGGGGAGSCIAGGAVYRVGTQFATSVPGAGDRGLCDLAAVGAGLPPEFIPSGDRAWFTECGYAGPNGFEPVGGCPNERSNGTTCNGEWDEHGRLLDAGTRTSMLCQSASRVARLPVQGTGKRFFVSREEWPGDLGGLSGADSRCRDVAADAGLTSPVSFRAFLGVGLVDAAARFRDGGPWSTRDGRLAFRNGASFATTPIIGLDRDEFSEPIDGGVLWTGSSTWLTATGADCAGWTSTSDGGSVGVVGATDAWWINAATRDCSKSAHLLCLEQ